MAELSIDSEPDPLYDFGATTISYVGLSNNGQANGLIDGLVNGILQGVRWADTHVAYSFTDNINDYLATDTHLDTYSVFSSFEVESAEYWFDQYSTVSCLTFEELTGPVTALDGHGEATIKLANSNTFSNQNAAATGAFPGLYARDGDIWFKRSDVDPSGFQEPVLGNTKWKSMGHEIGHTLGFAHGAEDGTVYGGIDGILPDDYNSSEYSIMTAAIFIGSTDGKRREEYGAPQTLMIADIATIQHLYGANFNSNAGSTEYTFSTLTGEMSIDGVGQGVPGANRVFSTVWDGNGTADHYNLSNYATNLSINLNPGEYSDFDVGGNFQRVDLYYVMAPGTEMSRGHLFNALLYDNDTRSLIENATGGSGNDTLTGNDADNVLKGNDGDDRLLGGAGQDTASYSDAKGGVTVNLTTFSASGADGTDVLVGIENIIGSNFDDVLTGNILDNKIQGLSGNDIINGVGGNNVIDGGLGFDAVSYALSVEGMTIDLSQGSITNILGTNTLISIEGIVGTDFNDTLIGTNADNLLDGGAGVDSVTYTSAISSVNANLTTGLATGGGGDDTLLHIETIYGSNHSDVLVGNESQNFLYGYNGNDVIDGGVGGNDVLDGGDDTDTLVFDYVKAGVVANLTSGTGSTDNGSLTLANFENIRGSAFDDQLTGDASENTILGGAGDDVIDGGLGGLNKLTGGEGNNTLSYASAGAAVVVDLNTQTASEGGEEDIISDFVHIIGSGFADTLTGDERDNVINGGNGNDVIDGREGNDTLSFEGSSANAVVNLFTGRTGFSNSNDTLISIENVIGSSNGDYFTSNSEDNIFDGRDGDDGVFYTESAKGVVVDLIKGSADGDGKDTLISIEDAYGSDFDDRIIASDVDNFLIGNDGIDTVVFSQNYADYTFEDIGSGRTEVTRTSTGELDELRTIELMQFADRLVTLDNTVPTALTIANMATEEATTVTGINMSAFFNDADGDALTYSATVLPEGLSIDANTGVVSGEISANVGIYKTTVTAIDTSNAQITAVFEWTVTEAPIVVPPNAAPTATDIADMTSEQASNVSGTDVTGNFADADNDVLTYSATGLPEGLVIDATTGIITGDITADVGEYNVVITATDPSNALVTNAFVWAVTAAPVAPTNTAPTATTIANLSNEEASTVAATDMTGFFADADGDTLTYSASGLPNGLIINATTGVITGDITAVAAIYMVTITATDPSNASVNNQFDWVVTETGSTTPPTNHAPTALAIANIVNDEGATVAPLDASGYFSDADSDTLTYTATGLPTGFSIDAATGIISGGLTNDANIYFVTITATDGSNATATSQFEWSVNAPAVVPDIVTGEPDNDEIFNALGNVNISGNAGHDSITVLAGINTIDGGADSDLLIGGFETDTMIGGAGNDVMRGDASDIIGGSDSLEGGADNDILMGGLGADIFKFNTNDGNDVIGKFNADDVLFDATTGYSVTATAADFMSGVDHIELNGFSSTNTSNVMDSISDIGGNAVFSAEGTEITFFGLLENQLSVNDFTFG